MILDDITSECTLLRRRLSVQHPSSFMGRERLTFRLHDTTLHIVLSSLFGPRFGTLFGPH